MFILVVTHIPRDPIVDGSGYMVSATAVGAQALIRHLLVSALAAQTLHTPLHATPAIGAMLRLLAGPSAQLDQPWLAAAAFGIWLGVLATPTWVPRLVALLAAFVRGVR